MDCALYIQACMHTYMYTYTHAHASTKCRGPGLGLHIVGPARDLIKILIQNPDFLF